MPGHSKRPTHASTLNSSSDITLVFDGGSLGNPGKGYGSYISVGAIETLAPIRIEYPGQTTNNEAEYMTMLEGLRSILARLQQESRDPATVTIEVFSDSKLVVEQVSGRWKVRQAHLRPFKDEALRLLSQFSTWKLIWQPRSESVRLLGH